MSLALDALLLAVGTVVLASVARILKLPPLLGMIAAGVMVTSSGLSQGLPGPGLDLVSSPLRLAALTVILLRAGLGISLEDLKAAGGLGLRLATLPLLGDAAVLTAASVILLDMPLSHALVLGLLVAAISPAIVIPGLLELRHDPAPESRRVLNALLVGAPIDNILAVVLMGVALDAALVGGSFSLSFVGVLLWKIGLGLIVGVVLGATSGWLLQRLAARIPRWLGVVLLGAAAATAVIAGLLLTFSYVLAVLALGATFRRLAPDVWKDLDELLLKIWGVVQYALFGLIGAAVDLGPVASAGLALAGVILLGQLGRALGSLAATTASGLSLRQRAACVLAYVPKATIQAAFAALAFDRGLDSGELILTAGVLAVVITAPIGVVSLHKGAARLLRGSPSG